MPAGHDHLSEEELAQLDALLADHDQDWWNRFYEDRARSIPFFTTSPDESLVEWVSQGPVRPGRAIDFGCGNGRNSVFLASRGFSVEAVDYSQSAIDWASQHIAQAGVDIRLVRRSVFELDPEPASYDLIYDSGCFHHIAPHWHSRYVALVANALRPGGWFGLTCFRPEGGSGYSDVEVYERRSLGGGMGYSEERLLEIWSGGLEVRVIRQMRETAAGSGLFGKSFLWSLLAQRHGS